MLSRKCEICGLRSKRDDGTKRFFMARFPLDKHRCKEWVKITGNEDLAYIPIEKLNELKFVCGNHFENKDFNAKKTRLKRTAVPSIRLNAKPLSDEQIKEFPYTLFKEECANNEVPSISLVAASSQMNDTHIHHFQPKEGPSTSTAVTASLEKIYYECDIPSVLFNIEVQTEEQRIIEKVLRKPYPTKKITGNRSRCTVSCREQQLFCERANVLYHRYNI